MVELNGESFYDDRMFLLHVCPITIKDYGRYRSLTIFHDEPPEGHLWGVVFYRNSGSFSVYKVEVFQTRDAAEAYRQDVAPQAPRVSLEGGSPQPQQSYAEYVAWVEGQGWSEFNPDKVFGSDRGNRKEKLTQELPPAL